MSPEHSSVQLVADAQRAIGLTGEAKPVVNGFQNGVEAKSGLRKEEISMESLEKLYQKHNLLDSYSTAVTDKNVSTSHSRVQLILKGPLHSVEGLWVGTQSIRLNHTPAFKVRPILCRRKHLQSQTGLHGQCIFRVVVLS